MYYLRYRPQVLTDIDNNNRREILTRVFESKNLPHAFLFTGPKGTGKTSTARIIAKILNCQKGRFFSQKNALLGPCNQCENCKAITKNRFLDVIELDAASSRGIDDIRALRDQVAYAPAQGKFKVYIIDEVHMLTKEAFNALLKTLEEPPSYVIFILATTEPQKLPETIVSRCLLLPFAKASVQEIENSLKRIIMGEKIRLDSKVLELIAKSSQGSFRDAAMLLEMAVSGTDLSLEAINLLLKNNTQLEPDKFLSLLVNRETNQALAYLQSYDNRGLDYLWLIEVLLERLRTMLLIKKNLIEDKDLVSDTNKLTLVQLSRLMKLLLEAYQLTKQSPISALPLMITVVEFTDQHD